MLPLPVIGPPLTLIPVLAVKSTLVTVPTLIEPPRLVLVPLIVIAEFVRLALPMSVRVLVVPEIDLFVRVSVVSLPTKVVVALGKVTTRPDVDTASNRVMALAELPELLKRMPLLKSVPSLIVTNPEPFG
jgi:hypothetical protein